jgi:bacteriocin biosynthesis cyclodehydratase domain-containing protein
MSNSDSVPSAEEIRLKDVFGVFVLSSNDVEFRTGSTSGKSFLVSDPEQRGLLGSVVEKIVSPQSMQTRPWNEAERELLRELMPELQRNGIVTSDDERQTANDARGFSISLLNKPLTEARIGIVGDGILGDAIRHLMRDIPCASITVIESSSVPKPRGQVRPLTQPALISESPLIRPTTHTEWIQTINAHDWIIAAQDSFEPEELTALNRAALQLGIPWSLVCFDGYEGWVGPTFVPDQTACFSCFRTRLYAGAAEPKHIFRDASVKVYRVPSPWAIGPESNAWVSLIASMFTLELIATMNGRGFTCNNMLSVHRLNLTFQRESVLRLPRCEECSPRRNAPRPNVFSNILATRVP